MKNLGFGIFDKSHQLRQQTDCGTTEDFRS